MSENTQYTVSVPASFNGRVGRILIFVKVRDERNAYPRAKALAAANYDYRYSFTWSEAEVF